MARYDQTKAFLDPFLVVAGPEHRFKTDITSRGTVAQHHIFTFHADERSV